MVINTAANTVGHAIDTGSYVPNTIASPLTVDTSTSPA